MLRYLLCKRMSNQNTKYAEWWEGHHQGQLLVPSVELTYHGYNLLGWYLVKKCKLIFSTSVQGFFRRLSEYKTSTAFLRQPCPPFFYYKWLSDSAPLAWIKTCCPPDLDGLCISDLQEMSWALRMRWLLLQKTEPNKPWSTFPVHVH
jgi:hypothetical protein